MPSGGWLTLATRADDDAVVVEVRDTGTGIQPRGHQAHLRPVLHHQGHRPRHRPRALRLLRHPAGARGRHLRGQRARPGHHLPGRAARHGGPGSGPPVSAESILVVDDEEVMRDVIGTLLGEAGYRVTLASDGAEGLALARKGSFDAAIVDVMLPEMSGLEVLEEIKKSRPRPRGADDHRLRLGGDGDPGHQEGRLRLRHQALQARGSPAHPAQRAQPAPPAGREPGPPPRAARPGPLRRHRGQEPAHGAGVRPHLPGRPLALDHPRGRARAAPARSWWPRPSTPTAPARTRPSSSSTRAACPTTCWSRTSSATSRAPLPAPCTRRRACSSWPTRARSSSTRSATSRWRPRPSCCA